MSQDRDEDPVPPTELIPDPQLPAPEADANGTEAANGTGAGEGDEPIIYRSGDSDEGAALSWDAPPGEQGSAPGEDEIASPVRRSELQDAYDCLGIRTPLEELTAFAKGRLEALVRAGEPERAQLAREAQELGLEALRRVMSGAAGSGQKEGA